MQRVIDRLTDHLDEQDPGGVRAAYLYGSAVAGGLRPDSDIDLLMVTERSLSPSEGRSLVDFLLRFSGSRATVTPGRPLELTSLVLADVVPWRYPPVCDFLYGEWLRDELADGTLPRRHVNPDLAVLLTTVRQHAHRIRGPSPAGLLVPVPPADLHRSMHDGLDALLDDLSGDERNVLLTLARMTVTLQRGDLLSKDEAARRILPGLEEPHRSVMSLAVGGYRGEVRDDWSERREEALATARFLADRIRAGHGPAR